MTTNRDWQKGREKRIDDNPGNYLDNFPRREKKIAKMIGRKSGRTVLHEGVPVADVDRSRLPPNHCYKLRNKPIDGQVPPWDGPTHGIDEELHYNSFAPTGEVYKYLPCAPYDDAANILGFKKVRGVDTIMERTGPYLERAEAFAPYKLLLYRGWVKNQPALDDKHRFIYLAQSMSGDVGDCFIRLEEVHNRMRNEVTPYIQDCRKAIESRAANRRCLNFRCWTVGGRVSTSDEQQLFDKLFKFVRQNEKADHIEEFRVWAEILRRSQGDKLASKEFFGRYWDAVIPDQDMQILTAGIRIVVSEAYFYGKGYGTLAKEITERAREDIRNEVWEAIDRVLMTPRLKFKPTLSVQNVIFHRDIAELPDGWNDLRVGKAEKLNNNGWRALEPHPGGLYYILVDCAVMDFLCSSARDKPLWRPGYNPPTIRYSEKLHQLLDKCGKTAPTTTYITTQTIAAAGKGKRNPTQDRCVATNAFSANVAMVTALPTIIPDPTKAKQMRIAEWLHRSAFSYGGIEEGILESSQVANNLVLGTPDTNTVMMRYEAFIKRLAYYSNKEKDDRVIVDTKIIYKNLANRWQKWMGDNSHQYSWLAPELEYKYQNNPIREPNVSMVRSFYPYNREGSMMFQALLDKSLESQCWGWNCWGDNAVVKALLESIAVEGDQQGLNKNDLKDRLRRTLNGHQEGAMLETDLDTVLKQNLG